MMVVQVKVVGVPMKRNTLQLTLDQIFGVELVMNEEITGALAGAPPQHHQGTDKKARFLRVQLRKKGCHLRLHGRNRDVAVFR